MATQPMHTDGYTIAQSIDKAAGVVGAAGSVLRGSRNKNTFSGTGAQTAFVIPHGLAVAPVSANVEPGSAAAAALFYISAIDATNITVTFAVAPANAANNVVLYWTAFL